MAIEYIPYEIIDKIHKFKKNEINLLIFLLVEDIAIFSQYTSDGSGACSMKISFPFNCNLEFL